MVSSRVNNKKGKKFAVWKNLFDTYLYEMLHETYCAEWYDETLEEWIHEEYGNRGDMLDVAREMHKDDGLQTRVCYGIFNGYDFEMISIAEIFE